MTTVTRPSPLALLPSLETAWQDVDSSFERFCLTAGIGAIEQMLCDDAQQLAGAPHNRGVGRIASHPRSVSSSQRNPATTQNTAATAMALRGSITRVGWWRRRQHTA